MAKRPLSLDWSELLPATVSPPPHEVEVVSPSASTTADAAEQSGEAYPLTYFKDHELVEKVNRLEAQFEALKGKLRDGGTKLLSRIRNIKEELHRREIARSREGAEELVEVKKLKVAETSRPCNSYAGSLSDSKSTLPQSSSFASYFTSKLKNEAGAAFEKELRFLNGDNKNCLKEYGHQKDVEKHPRPSLQLSKISTRQQPFQSLVEVHKERTLDDDKKLLSHTRSSSQGSKSLSRRVSATCPEAFMDWEKVQDVVLLDEECSTSAIQEDTPDEWKEVKIYYPSRDDREAVELSYLDIKCLDPECYLSSPIMNFYIQYLQRSSPNGGSYEGNYHIFNTYFYKKLEEAVSSKGDITDCFLKLRRWWKGVQLFRKAYVLIPIHGDLHWSLVIICFPGKEDEFGPIILHLDSLGIHTSRPIFRIIDSFIKCEWEYLCKESPTNLPFSDRVWKSLPHRIDVKNIEVPRQNNEYDCGLFVLYFMERFIRDAPRRLRKRDISMFGKRWFKPQEASNLRSRIRNLLLEEFQSARLENGKTDSSPNRSTDSDFEQDKNS